MKALLYSLIAILLFGSIAPAFNGRNEDTKSIFVRPEDSNVSAAALDKSAAIISKRLNLYFMNSGAVAATVPGKQLIRVNFPASANIRIVEDLVTHKGALAFYEVYDHREMVELLNGDNTLFSMMKTDSTDNKSGRLGCVPVERESTINEYLKTLDTGNRCLFAWTQDPEKPEACLLPLKAGDNNPVIKGSDIDSSAFSNGRIYISLKKEASLKWAETTKRDIGKTIAIVLDDYVISYPTVRSVIEGGKIEMTGNYSASQGRYIAAMLNSGEMPARMQTDGQALHEKK